MNDSASSTLAARLDITPEKWDYETGDVLIGRVIDVGTWSGEYGESPTVTVLVDEAGSTEQGGNPIPLGAERIIYCSPTVVRNEIEKQSPRNGDRLAVKFRGDHPNGYKDFRVIVVRNQPPEWLPLSVSPDEPRPSFDSDSD
jgi:hypothetical protein